MGVPPGANIMVDHINGDGLDNRRENLRWANPRQNCLNSRKREGTSRYKGVYFNKANGKWTGQISMPNGLRASIGYHIDEETAARRRDELAVKYHARYAG